MHAKKTLDFSYQMGEWLYIALLAIFGILAMLFFGLEGMAFVVIALIITHEVPSFIMGWYISKALGAPTERNEKR